MPGARQVLLYTVPGRGVPLGFGFSGKAGPVLGNQSWGGEWFVSPTDRASSRRSWQHTQNLAVTPPKRNLQ